MAATDEEVTPTRVLTLEHNYENLGKEVRGLSVQISEERKENKEFQEIIFKKLNEKSDFNLLNTMKTVLTTIAIVAAVVSAVDYRISSSVAAVVKDGEYRDKALLLLDTKTTNAVKHVMQQEIQLSNTQKEVDGLSSFVDHFQYIKEYPIKINTMESDIKMLKYKYKSK